MIWLKYPVDELGSAHHTEVKRLLRISTRKSASVLKAIVELSRKLVMSFVRRKRLDRQRL